MNYHTLHELSDYLNNNKVDIIASLNKYNQGYKNTYLYKPLPLRVHHKNIKNYLNRNYKLKVYGINTLEESKEVMKYNVTIVSIEFAYNFDSYVDVFCLPKTLKFIVFGHFFNQYVDNLPQTLISIKFGHCFNKNVDNLPKKLRIIKFGAWFNQTVNNLPQNLQSIVFGKYFNKFVDKLPQTLQFITFDHFFNQSVDKLPQSLQSIVFGSKFNKNVDKLPSKLHTIVFGYSFDQSINNLPQTLHTIELGFCFNQSIDNLPQKLQVIVFGRNFNKSICGWMFGRPKIKLPRSLKKIKIEKNTSINNLILPQNICVERY